MATATAAEPHATTEIVRAHEWEGDERRVDFVWTWHGTAGDVVTEAFGTERTQPFPRELLEDRWNGIMGGGNASKMLLKLDGLILDIASELTRRDLHDDIDRWVIEDGEAKLVSEIMSADELEHVIRDWMLERAARVAVR